VGFFVRLGQDWFDHQYIFDIYQKYIDV